MKAANWMPRFCLTALVQAALCFSAQAFDLKGAWATESDICPKIFAKTSKAIIFKDDSEDQGKGFIVDGNVVRGQRIKCVIKSMKEKGPETNVIASCATEIMVDQVRLTFRAVDENRIARVFAGIGGFESNYVRCRL
jgi:hypothetical protein